MKGKFFSVGVGPGDPELVTLKAVRCMKSCPVWALPQGHAGKMTAKSILENIIRLIDSLEMKDKEVVTLHFPMTGDEAVLARAHGENAAAVEARLRDGKDVALFTLGCPTVYASSTYVRRRVAADGFYTETVPSVTSFAAAAAALKTDLCKKNESLIIVPAMHEKVETLLDEADNAVIMKPSGKLEEIKDILRRKKLIDRASLAERCGLEGEALYPRLVDALENSYFSVILVKKGDEP